jgi:succinate dehydrogenase / fumarate reductase iron-sulfur subunit
MARATFRIWRGDASGGRFEDYPTEVGEGMVVLDAVHRIQAEQASDLAVRWNCKAGRCGSCSAEVNGRPRLMCMTRMSELPLDKPITVEPMKAFPLKKDLVTDVSWNYRVKQAIKPFKPRPPDAPDGTWRMAQADVDRVQEFRKCVEDRTADLRGAHGVGLCNITKCCTKVCPEGITITDNAIIPLKERVVDRFYDPVRRLFRVFGSGA